MTVLAFGAVAEALGGGRFEMAALDSTTELTQKLQEEFPALKSISFAIAVNKQLVTESTRLESNDTVALLPPFSGG